MVTPVTPNERIYCQYCGWLQGILHREECPTNFPTNPLDKTTVDEAKRWEEFHPRAVKLLRKRKNFLVVAEDEPYFMQVYEIIREHEGEIGRWTEEDEFLYRAAEIAKESLL